MIFHVLSQMYPFCFQLNNADDAGMLISHIAAREGHVEMLDKLISHGAVYTSKDKLGLFFIHKDNER